MKTAEELDAELDEYNAKVLFITCFKFNKMYDFYLFILDLSTWVHVEGLQPQHCYNNVEFILTTSILANIVSVLCVVLTNYFLHKVQS